MIFRKFFSVRSVTSFELKHVGKLVSCSYFYFCCLYFFVRKAAESLHPCNALLVITCTLCVRFFGIFCLHPFGILLWCRLCVSFCCAWRQEETASSFLFQGGGGGGVEASQNYWLLILNDSEHTLQHMPHISSTLRLNVEQKWSTECHLSQTVWIFSLNLLQKM